MTRVVRKVSMRASMPSEPDTQTALAMPVAAFGDGWQVIEAGEDEQLTIENEIGDLHHELRSVGSRLRMRSA